MGLEQTVSEGIVSSVREIQTIGTMFQVSAPISPGSSGSPVVNMKGQVIGVAAFQLIDGQNLNFAVSGQEIPALKSEKKSKTLAEWTLDVSIKERDAGRNVYKQGLKFLWVAEYEKALDHFKKAIEVNKHFAEAWFHSGNCYSKLDRYKEAIEAFKQAILIKPDYAESHLNLGAVYYERLGRHQEAMEAFKQALRIKPDYAQAHLNLGVAYGGLGRYQEAMEAFKQAIRIKPDYAYAHYILGLAHSILGDKGSAIEEYEILKTLDKGLAYKLLDLIYQSEPGLKF
jgi:tetratricopeptide (TPR) repeat protein